MRMAKKMIAQQERNFGDNGEMKRTWQLERTTQ